MPSHSHLLRAGPGRPTLARSCRCPFTTPHSTPEEVAAPQPAPALGRGAGGGQNSSVGKGSAFKAGDPGSIPGSGRSAEEGKGYPLQYSWASLVAWLVKNPPAMRETWVRSLGREDPLEKGKATHSSILAWRIPWTTVHGIPTPWDHKEWDMSDFHIASLQQIFLLKGERKGLSPRQGPQSRGGGTILPPHTRDAPKVLAGQGEEPPTLTVGFLQAPESGDPTTRGRSLHSHQAGPTSSPGLVVLPSRGREPT